jgi:hypothetical protein
MIKISHEVPKCLLTASPEFNDYDYCLPHLLDQDEEYLQYFLDAKSKDRYITMDNSLHELGQAYDHKRLLHWIQEIEPDEFIVPDVWMKSAQTVAQAKYWLQFKYPKKTKITAVVQGEDKKSALMCAFLLKDLGYKKLNISYGATWYGDTALEKALGRINFVNELLKDKTYKDIKFHLLGCAVPQEFGWYDKHPQIESIDTSNPIMAAIDGNMYTERGLSEKPKANMNDHFNCNFEDIDYLTILHNTEMFRKINGFAYIQNIPGKILNSIKHG